MGNCLITKLNAAIDDSALLKIGELRIGFGQNDGSYDTFINFKEGQDLEVIAGAGIISTNSTSDKIVIEGNVIHVAASIEGGSYGGGFRSSANDGLVSIPNKYLLTRVFLNANSWGDLNVDDLKYSPFLKVFHVPGSANINITGDISSIAQCTDQITIPGTNITGDTSALNNNNYGTVNLVNTNVHGNISDFANFTELTNLNISNTSISGDVVSLSNCIKVTTISAYGTNVEGAYELFVEGQCAAGRTSGTCALGTKNGTVNGNKTNEITHYADFNGTGAILRTTAAGTVATYTKSTNTWAYK